MVPLAPEYIASEVLQFLLGFATKNDFELILLASKSHPDSNYLDTLRLWGDQEEALFQLEEFEGDIADAIVNTCDHHVLDLVAFTATDKAKELGLSLKRPTLFFPEGWMPREIARIGFACDNSSFKDSSVLTILWHLAMELKAEVHIIHVSTEPIQRWELNGVVEDTIEFYLHDVKHQYDFIHGEDISLALLKYSVEKKLDLIATMPRDRGANKSDEGGRVTKHLVNQSAIPLITID